MAAFQKSDRLNSLQYRTSVYAPGAITNVAIPANSTAVFTITVPFAWKYGAGLPSVFLPSSQTPLATGLSLGDVNLLAPASGSFAAGNHPRVQFKVINSTIGAITPPATDVVLALE